MPSLSDNNVKVHISTDADTDGIDKTRRSLDDLDSSSIRSNKSAALLGSAVKVGATGVIALGAAVGGATVSGFGFNSSVETATATINAFTKDAGLTKQIMKDVKEESLKTQFSFTDMAEATAGLIPASKQSGVALKDLIKQAEILGALNPAEGLTGGAFALKEALSGDFTSIVERFNLPRQRLNQLKAEGVPAMQAIQTALSEMGIDYSLVAAQGATTGARWDTMKDQFTQLAGQVTKPIFDGVSSKLAELSGSIDWVDWGNKGVNAMNTLISIGSKVVTTIQYMTQFWGEHKLIIAVIAGMIAGPLVFAFGAWAIAAGAAAISTFIAMAPLILLGAAVGAAAYLIYTHWEAIKNAFSTAVNWIKGHADLLIAIFFGIPGLIGMALWNMRDKIIAPFQGAFEYVKSLPEKMVNLFSNLGSSIKNVIGNIDIPGPLGKVKDVIPGFARGGYTGAGGTNDVAGFVHRGEYVIPKSQVDQNTGLPKGAGGGITINFHGPVSMRDEQEVQSVGQMLARQLQAARAGAF